MNLDLGLDRLTQIVASVGACVLVSDLARWFGYSSTEPVFPDQGANSPELLAVEVPPWLEEVALPVITLVLGYPLGQRGALFGVPFFPGRVEGAVRCR